MLPVLPLTFCYPPHPTTRSPSPPPADPLQYAVFHQLEVPRLVQSLCDCKSTVQRTACVELVQLCNGLLISPASSISAAALSTLMPAADGPAGTLGFLPLLPMAVSASMVTLEPQERLPVHPEDVLPACDIVNLQVMVAGALSSSPPQPTPPPTLRPCSMGAGPRPCDCSWLCVAWS